ncbi:hypothetical protein ITJ54_09310 [Curtobacterium sp. VKM Ac-2865]|nr:hypothetical protein [Curtobacterium sp. VKM Ac-2865]
MFPFVWRVLPGPTALKVIELLLLVAVVVFALFTWVFPFIAADILPPPDGTVDTSATPTP